MSIIGVGNALTDIIIDIPSESVLDRLGFPLGGMYMIEEEDHYRLLDIISGYPHSFAAGGSAANTINGLAKLGLPVAFTGKVGNDITGREFAADQTTSGISTWLEVSDDMPSGKCISMVLEGGERTMATYLGSSINVSGHELTPQRLKENKILYVEGYIVYNRALIEDVMRRAKEAGLMVALDLASYNVVKDNREVLHYLVAEYVDIIFANQQEAFEFTGLDEREALESLAEFSKIAVVKTGACGSLVARGKDRFHVGVIDDAIPRDKTGAGDLYASGFLYGLCKGYSLDVCAEIGAILSSKVIEVAGPKMDECQWSEIRGLVERIENGDHVVAVESI